MRLSGLLILVGTLVGLNGCKPNIPRPGLSESTERTEAQPPVTPQTSADLRPLVVCFGDSLTAGFGADPGSSYPDFLQKDLDAKGYKYRVVNEGVSGNTSKDGVERLPGIVAMKPAIVVVEFGGNDGLRGVDVQVTRGNLANIVQTLQSAGAKIVLAGITLPPDYGADYIQQFTRNYTSIARQFRVPLLPFLLQGVYGVDGMMQADRTHATAKGNEVVARNVLPYLLPLLRK